MKLPDKMLQKDTVAYGLLLAFMLPLLGSLLFYGIFEGLENLGWVSSEGFRPLFRERTTSVVGIALNAWLINQYSKNRSHRTVRGVVLATTALVILWLVIFGKYVI